MLQLPVLILVVLIGIGVLIYLHFKKVGPAKAVLAWPVAPGVMLATAVREPAPGAPALFQPLVHYRYHVGGADLEGVQLRQAETATYDRNKAYADIAPYPPGTQVHVRYNPHRPEESVLEWSPIKSPFLLIAGGLGLLLLLGIGTLAALESGLFDDPPAPYSAPAPLTMDDMNMSGTTAPTMVSPTVPAAPSVNNHATAIIGRWAKNGDCSRVMQFLADGTIINPSGNRGTWTMRPVSARQSILTISGGGLSVRAWFDYLGPYSYQLTPMDSSPQFTITPC